MQEEEKADIQEPELDIFRPIHAWILSELHDAKEPISRKTLLKQLCSAAFEAMESNDAFAKAMKELTSNNLIEFVSNTVEVETEGFSLSFPKNKTSRKIEGYEISELGIIIFRRQIVGRGHKIRKFATGYGDLHLHKGVKEYQTILNAIISTRDMTKTIIDLIQDNAPQTIEAIKRLLETFTPHGTT